MKKKLISLSVVAVLLAVLTAVFIWINGRNQEENNSSNQPEPVSQTQVKDIEGITYTSESTSGEAVSLVRREDIWYYEKDEDFPIDQEYVTNTMVLSAAQATANKTIEKPEDDLSQYGLDHPAVTIVLKKINGEEVRMSIGSYNESVQGYYLQVEGEDKLYMVDGKLVFAFDMSLYEIAYKETFPLVEESSFTHIKIEKDAHMLEYKGVVEKDAEERLTEDFYREKVKTWKVSEDGSMYSDGDQQAITQLITQLSGLSFSKMIEYHADESVKERYGLTDGAVRLTVDYQVLDETTARQVEVADGITETVCDTLDKQYVLLIGSLAPDDGYSEPEYYVSLEGSQVIYTISETELHSVVEMNVK